jgi:beta-lactamase regulating signal transducer with metallopeptidase domain
MSNAPTTTFLIPADSARIVADAYSVSLVVTMLSAAAVVAFYCLRHSNAGARAILWRCTLVTLLALCAGRFGSWEWMAWVLPDPLARPLVSLGTIDLRASPVMAGSGDAAARASTILPIAIALYCAGVAAILLPTVIARGRLAITRRRAVRLTEQRWLRRLREAGNSIAVSTSAVQLAASPDVAVPVTWGVWRPVILLPDAAVDWPDDRLQAVLRHELVHVGAHDSAMRLAARVACAVFWFHPGVWWMARRFDADAEEASDDRVLLSGVRASDYAEWLGASVPATNDLVQPAMALVRRGNLRARLAVVTNTERDIALPARRLALFAMSVTAAVIVPLATARLAPTRDVLTSLMTETRWESRAWAVVHLARRADSVDVARSAARSDPDPAVRAWARYALGLSPASPGSHRRS